MFQRKAIIDVTPTPDELASEFADMDAEQQAMFFSELARITDKWDNPFCFQLQAITDNPALTDEARYIMTQIGEYGPKHFK